MLNDIAPVRIGLILAMLTLLFGIGMGINFGVNEDGVKGYVKEGVAAHAQLHDAKSESKIWRYAQRAHFHATGVGAFALGMILVAVSATLTGRGGAGALRLWTVGGCLASAAALLGIAVGGSLAGTALSVRSGAMSRWANVFTGLIFIMLVLLFGNLVELVAEPAIAALLIVAGLETPVGVDARPLVPEARLQRVSGETVVSRSGR